MAEITTTPLPEEEKPKTVVVPAEQLQQLIDSVGKQAEEIKTLREAVNQNRLSEVEDKKKPKELPKAFLKVYNGKIITGWRAGANKLVYSPTNPNLVIGEVLQTVLKYIDGSESDAINQQDMTRTEDRVWVRVQSAEDLMNENVKTVKVKAEKLETANEELKMSFQIPSEVFEIEKKFLNP